MTSVRRSLHAPCSAAVVHFSDGGDRSDLPVQRRRLLLTDFGLRVLDLRLGHLASPVVLALHDERRPRIGRAGCAGA